MTDHASLLREAATAIRPMIEDDLDKREIYAAWRKKFSDAGLDWMAFKSLQKARVEDDRDESGDGKRVAKIMDRLECTAAYAEMLGYGSAKMNENNCFSGSYADAKGRGVEAASTPPHDPETGEITDNKERPETAQPAPMVVDGDSAAGRRPSQASLSTFHPEDTEEGEGDGPDRPSSVSNSNPVANVGEGANGAMAAASYDPASRDDDGADLRQPASSGLTGEDDGRNVEASGGAASVITNPHSSEPPRSNTAGEAPSSSQASPAANHDPYDPGDIPAFLDRRQPKTREWESA